jgi:hypothetical protein
MTERHVLLVCEGPDEIACIRELLNRKFGFEIHPNIPSRPPPPAGEIRSVDMRSAERNLWVSVRAKEGKSQLVQLCRSEIQNMSPASPYERVGINFDPDGETEVQWRKSLFEESWTPPLVPQRDGTYLHEALPVIPLPWEGGATPFDHLEDHHCLERLMLGAALQVEPELMKTIEGWLNEVDERLAHRLLPGTPKRVYRNWKTATRMLAGLRFPDKSVPGVAQQFFGQNQELWTALEPTLQASRFWTGLEQLLHAE